MPVGKKTIENVLRMLQVLKMSTWLSVTHLPNKVLSPSWMRDTGSSSTCYSYSSGQIQKVETSRFARADLENRLLMVDDDLNMNALPKTNYIKSIVTAEAKMDVERKGIQSYQSDIYARFLCLAMVR